MPLVTKDMEQQESAPIIRSGKTKKQAKCEQFYECFGFGSVMGSDKHNWATGIH